MNNWYRFLLSGLQRGYILELLGYFEEYEDIFKLGSNFLKKEFGFKEDIIEKIYKSKDVDLKSEMEKLNELNVNLVFIRDENYPEKLLNLPSPPIFLHYKGKFELYEKSIAIIGTRKMTVYGKNATEYFAKKLAENGVAVISGLALGVDVTAHNAVLKTGGKTIAVVGTGLDVVYPPQNSKIWEQIEQNGLLISEYILGTPGFKWNFPERNRIVAGLSNGVLITESYKRGGALITCDLALENGKEVFAVPGYIFYPSFEGCNKLIKDCRAKLVTEVNDILEEFSWTQEQEFEKMKMSKLEELIYKRLGTEKTIDELILETKLKSSELLTIITEMEIKGIVRSMPGGRYFKSN